MSPQIMTDILDESFFTPTLSKKKNRVFAAIIDLGLVVATGAIITTTYGTRYETVDGTVGYHLTGPLTIIPLLVWIIIVPVLEAISGQSLGKMLFQIKVVSKEYSRASPAQVIVRHLFDVIDWLPGFGIVGLLVASNNPYSQRVGDLVAKTVVIKK